MITVRAPANPPAGGRKPKGADLVGDTSRNIRDYDFANPDGGSPKSSGGKTKFTDRTKLVILLVDDKANTRRTLRHMLSQLGYDNFIEAGDGEEAMAKIRHSKPDMIISDWNMPRMNGGMLLRAVRDNDEYSDIPFLIITVEQNRETVAEASEVEVDAYILKPFTPDLISEKINSVMEARLEPSQIDVHLAVGQAFLKCHQYQQAVDEFLKVLKINTKSPRALLAIGQCKEALGEIEEAKALFRKAVDLSPLFIKAHEALGNLYQEQGDLTEAATHLERAVEISPRNVDRQVRLGKNLIKTGRTAKAKGVFENVLDLAQENYNEVLKEVGESYMEAGLFEEAQAAFEQALEANPHDLRLYNRLGMAYRRQTKYAAAVDNYLRALRIDPDNEVLYFNLGRAQHENGDRESAIESMKRALAIYSEFDEARAYLKQLLEG